MTKSPYLCTIKSKQLENMSKIALGTWAWFEGNLKSFSYIHATAFQKFESGE